MTGKVTCSTCHAIALKCRRSAARCCRFCDCGPRVAPEAIGKPKEQWDPLVDLPETQPEHGRSCPGLANCPECQSIASFRHLLAVGKQRKAGALETTGEAADAAALQLGAP